VQLWDKGLLAALSGVAAGVLSIVVLYRAWLAGGVGGGDVKLAAAVAIWVGLPHMPTFVLATAIAGGAVAVVCYALSDGGARRQIHGNLTGALLVQELPRISTSSTSMPSTNAPGASGGVRRVSVPYGIAVAVGGAVALCAPWSF
ncbi:MAG: prepilin peptidase CpaA, partial [Myxococcales bacterium]|nr:prepilin peptidase CpaA [Myxococcales bacterium]